MTRITMMTASLILLPYLAQADEVSCPDLGLDNEFLNLHFCEQLQAVVPGTGTTRSITQEGNPDLPEDADWAQFPLIQDAYRADPRKTLDLIARIKGAGGLPITEN